jgi:hypothetical protein
MTEEMRNVVLKVSGCCVFPWRNHSIVDAIARQLIRGRFARVTTVAPLLLLGQEVDGHPGSFLGWGGWS